MSEAPRQRVTGRCLCGAVRYSAAPRALHVDACHCGMCRRWSAGPMFALDCGDTVEVEDWDQVTIYRSSQWAERCFCKQCGTSMFYRLAERPFYAVSAETLDDREGLVFTNQIFVDEKPAYYTFADQTKMMTGAEVFAAFQGSSEQTSA